MKINWHEEWMFLMHGPDRSKWPAPEGKQYVFYDGKTHIATKGPALERFLEEEKKKGLTQNEKSP